MKHNKLKKEQKGIARKRGQMDTVTETVICRGDAGHLKTGSFIVTAWKCLPGDSETFCHSSPSSLTVSWYLF